EAEAAALPEQSPMINTDGLARIMEVLTDAERNLRDAPSKKIFIEVALIKAMQARNSVSIDVVLKRLQQLRGESNSADAPSHGSASQNVNRAGEFKLAEVATAAPMPAQAPVAAAASPIDANLEALWRNVIDAVGRVSPFARSYLLEAHPVSFEK